MNVSLTIRAALTAGVAAGAFVFASSAFADVPAGCVKGVDLATLGPTSIVGHGPHGEKAASPEVLKLSDAEAEKVKAGHFKVGISMQTVNLDWSQLQVQGITDTLKKYGVSVTGVASAEYQVDKQIADIENTIQQHPDGIISIPVDFTATAPTYKKVSQAGIKLVFMNSIPTGLKHPEEYAAMVSADSQGNGEIAAQILASCVAKDGTIGLVNFGVDYFSTNERTKGVREWMQKNRPDIKMKQVDFTDPAKVSQIAGDFLTANPDVKGVFAVWDQPALDTLSAMRAQGINIPVTTVDLGLQSAIEIAKGGPLKATGSQRPYDQGAAEAMAMMNALIGKETPAWVGVQSLPVVQSNVLESYKTVFKKDPPAELRDAGRHRVGVLAGGRHVADAARGLRHLDRRAGDEDLAGDRVGHLHQHLALPQMRVDRDLRDGLDRRDRDFRVEQRLDDVVDGVLGAPFRHRLLARVALADPAGEAGGGGVLVAGGDLRSAASPSRCPRPRSPHARPWPCRAAGRLRRLPRRSRDSRRSGFRPSSAPNPSGSNRPAGPRRSCRGGAARRACRSSRAARCSGRPARSPRPAACRPACR